MWSLKCSYTKLLSSLSVEKIQWKYFYFANYYNEKRSGQKWELIGNFDLADITFYKPVAFRSKKLISKAL